MRITSIIIAVAILVIILLLTRPDRRSELGSLSASFVHVGTVEQMDVQAINEVTGKLQPARKTQLHFEITGRVESRHVEPGQDVNKGDVLLEIDNGDFVDAAEDAQALLEQEARAIERDRNLLDLAVKATALKQRELQRIQQLGEDSLASQSRFDEASQALYRQMEEETRLRHNAETADSRLKYRRAALNRANRNLNRTKLKAPFGATINRVTLEIGDYVTPGKSAVDLIKITELDIYLETSTNNIASLVLGQRLNVGAGDQIRIGEIIALTKDPDPLTNTHALRIRIDADGQYPGQLIKVELPGEFLPEATVVPVMAIMRDEGESFVFRIEGNFLSKTPIKTGVRVKDYQVVEGIAPGSRIVIRDVAALADGQEVIVER